MAYWTGSLVRLATYAGDVATPTGGFRDASGTLADPTTVQLKVKDPSGTTTTSTYQGTGQTYAIVRDAAGLYHADVDTTGHDGGWVYEWIGSGSVQAIAPNSFETSAPPL